MMHYLYDGTFEGFLTCIYYHYYKEKAAGIYRQDCYQASFLAGYHIVKTEEEKASRVYEAIEEKISAEDLRRIYRVFLSSDKEKENKLLKYIRLGFKTGSAVSLLHSNPIVFDVQQCEKKVSVETHRMIGLLRFSALGLKKEEGGVRNGKKKEEKEDRHNQGEILYCAIEPDHDILELIADHFSDRLKSDAFIIHDKARNKAVFAQGGNWHISNFTDMELQRIGEKEREKEYQILWKKYFDAIAIQERINPGCQKRCMPVRYWKNLTEFH